MLTDDEIRAMLEGTKGVTQGPWRLIGWHPNGLYGPGDLHSAKAICHFTDQRPDKEKVVANRDPEHIARCDPTTIAELCTETLALRARMKVLEDALRVYGEHDNWLMNGLFDADSGNFKGPLFANAALQEQSK
jgi:hypothetical protein